MKQHDPKSLEELVDEQCLRWEHKGKPAPGAARPPVIMICRQAGSLGRKTARKLAGELNMEMFGSNIIAAVAKEAGVSERLIRTLDEHGRSHLDDMLAWVEEQYGMISDDYFTALVKVLTTIYQHGNAIILGHGASQLFRDPRDLRVRFIAPEEMRIKNMMADFDLSEEEAGKRVSTTDADRKAYLHKYFNVTQGNETDYDLIINNAFFGIDDSVALIKEAFRRKNEKSSHTEKTAII